MSIKIEGGDGTAENVIKAGTSNELLYNDKEVLLKENFGLLPPDLTKAEVFELVDYEQNLGFIIKPFTVPEDGWIIKVSFISPADDYIKIDGHGGVRITPSQELLFWSVSDNGNNPCVIHNINCPYSVKKGQVIEAYNVQQPGSYTTFAPCMSV